MRTESAGFTDVGRRANNEDSFCVQPELGLFAVADGVGGYEGGEVASHLAIDTLVEFFRRNAQDPEVTWPCKPDPSMGCTENLVKTATLLAQREICARKHGRLSAMGSTLAALVIHETEVVIAHLGDSRVYRLRGGHLVCMTRDHSLYERMRQDGELGVPRSSFPYRNVILRALGMEGDGNPDLRVEQARAGDVYLLCSDGLSDPVTEDTMTSVLASMSAEEACTALVHEAYEQGGQDNITAVVVRLGS